MHDLTRPQDERSPAPKYLPSTPSDHLRAYSPNLHPHLHERLRRVLGIRCHILIEHHIRLGREHADGRGSSILKLPVFSSGAATLPEKSQPWTHLEPSELFAFHNLVSGFFRPTDRADQCC